MWFQLTNAGDLAVMMPAAIMITFWLLFNRPWPQAWLWPLLFGTGVLLVAISKIAYVGWGIGCQAMNFTGISGHTLQASAVFPLVFYLIFSTYRPRWRFAGLVAGLVCGGVIGFSRLTVRAHSLSEVVAGFVLGLVICLVFAIMDPAQRICRPRLGILLGALAVLMLTVTGSRAPGRIW